MLLPALARARSKAHRTQCYNNQRQISVAFIMYSEDNRDFFPAYNNWATWGGDTGNPAFSSYHGAGVGPTNRPLNRYTANSLRLYQCPADKGDSIPDRIINANANCYQAWGNSYLMTWGVERYLVQHCGGDSQAAAGSTQATPIKTSRIAVRAVNKLILSDWPWFGDRDINDKRSVWHNDRGRPVFPTLMGDGHVENFKFPTTPPRQTFDGTGYTPQPWGNPSLPMVTWW